MYHFVKYVSFYSMVKLWLKSHRLDVWPRSTFKSHVPFHTRSLSTLCWRRHVLSVFFCLSCSEIIQCMSTRGGVWWCRQCSVWRSALCVVRRRVPTWTLSRHGRTQYSLCSFASSALHSLKYAHWLYFIVTLCVAVYYVRHLEHFVHIVNSYLVTAILFVCHVFQKLYA